MTEIPESLLKRSAEAKAKALGLPVEQVIAEMKGEALPATPPPTPQPEPEPATKAQVKIQVQYDPDEVEVKVKHV